MLTCKTWNTDVGIGIALRRVAQAAIRTEMGATYDEVVGLDLGVIAYFIGEIRLNCLKGTATLFKK